MPASGFRFSAVPPKVRGIGTFPVRAFASSTSAVREHGGASAREHDAGVLDAECVLPARVAAEHFFGVHVERAGEIVDARDPELDRAQRHEKPRRGDAAGGARDQPAVHGHRLRTVFAQVHRAKPPVAAERIVGAPCESLRAWISFSVQATTSSSRHIAPLCGISVCHAGRHRREWSGGMAFS